ncbi:hypothetical protein BZG12_10325 [Salinivibrio kushneri]|nr:hypothetical protein BZG12_10325 [Salinivibrio kushneri]
MQIANGRAAHIVIMIGIVLALIPTYAWFLYRWCHRRRLLVPTLLRGNAYNDKIYTLMVPLA